VSLVVLLDAGPLGLVTNPRETADTEEANLWLTTLAGRGDRIIVPEIADYEVRRELIRANKRAGVRRLDALKAAAEYLPITTDASSWLLASGHERASGVALQLPTWAWTPT
jgi:hypothetical protein